MPAMPLSALLPITYLPTCLCICSFYLSTHLPSFLPSFLPSYLSTYLATLLPTYPPTYLTYLPTFQSFFLSTFLPTCMPTFLPTCISSILFCASLPPPSSPLDLHCHPRRCDSRPANVRGSVLSETSQPSSGLLARARRQDGQLFCRGAIQGGI
jgi:hypothetical protein